MASLDKYDFRALVRAARSLLGWSQAQLAQAARVGVATIADYERGARNPIENNLLAIRTALETAGIRFTDEGLGGVILTRRPADPPPMSQDDRK